MSSQRFVAIILIFVVASVAWVGLGRTLQYRTANLEESLSKEVNTLWGPEDLVQPSPVVYSSRDDRESGDATEPLDLKQANSEGPDGGIGDDFLGAKSVPQPRAA